MFLVLNREKISSYIVAFSTVIVLFIMSVVINQRDTVETAANTVDNTTTNEIKENITSINIGENYSKEDVERIIKILNENESKVDFYVYKSWAENNQESINSIKNQGYQIYQIDDNKNENIINN